MSHVTQGQAKRLAELLYPQGTSEKIWFPNAAEPLPKNFKGEDIEYVDSWDAPSAEELMEWLAEESNFSIEASFGNWHLVFNVDEERFNELVGSELTTILFQAACLVLEGKK